MTPTEKRHETAQVDNYLRALETQQSKLSRGRRTREWLTTRLLELDVKIPATSGVARLGLFEERARCQADLRAFADVDSLDALEQAFVKVAAAYSERAGISYQTWREVGVPVNVLADAGVTR